MKITNQEIISALDAINTFGKREMSTELAFKIFDISKKLADAYEPYLKTLEKLKNQYKDDQVKFLEEATKLIKIIREIDVDKIKREEILEAGIKVTPAELADMRSLIDG